ncbi:MAG TPA: ATP-binding protein [Chloroflexia bacterium]|nr:ATP-binding protein [Chloroflexia bacterium]
MIQVENTTPTLRALTPPTADLSPVRELAPRAGWSEVGEAAHFAQFYETDHSLLHSLSGFIGAGLRAGEAGIVVATPAHRADLAALLQQQALDVDAARASGQYVVLDAAETLARFMVDGAPEPVRFAMVVGPIIAQAARGRPRVRVFGEMVALLWTAGNREAAIRLEELWNTLQQTQAFVLYCAYPMHGFDGAALAQPLDAVCAAHSHVIPTESYTALPTADDRLRAVVALQQKARRLETVDIENARLRHEVQQALAAWEELLAREQQARADAEHANRMKDEFLATVSHELRTPLTTIIAWSQRLRKSRRDELTVARGLEIIERNAKIQAQLVEDILDVSRVIVGKLSLHIAPVDAVSVLNAAIDTVQLTADAKGIQLEVILDPAARHIAGDARRLQQVFWNLLANAIKFTPAGGHVEVRLERMGAVVQISVSDSGEGIPAEFLPFIFDHFRQADGTSTRRHGGLGLGLAIVRHLVELHGGTVHAESAGPGWGATFRIRLPLAEAPGLKR